MKKTQLIIAALFFAMNVSSQCFDDQHSTNWFDAWVACEPAQNPNPDRGNSYWIQYDFGATYTMGQTHFWNINDPAHKNYGLRNIVIDYSVDGVNWTEWGNHYLLQASGLPSYDGLAGPDLNNIQARYVIITAVDNWGGACYGLSELKIDVGTPNTDPPIYDGECLHVEIFPNPAIHSSAMQIKTLCEGDVVYFIRNVFGDVVAQVNLGPIDGKLKVGLPIEDLSPGVYLVVVYQKDHKGSLHLVVQ